MKGQTMVINSKPLKMMTPHKAAVLAEHLESERNKHDGRRRHNTRSSSKTSLKPSKKINMANQRTDRSQININEEQLPEIYETRPNQTDVSNAYNSHSQQSD